MKQSIQDVLKEHQNVLNTRERIENIFKMVTPKCHVTVGGSYMLKYWCDAFHNREVSDYDFILYILEEDKYTVHKFIHLLDLQTGCFAGGLKYYDNTSFYMGYLNGKKVNVIIKVEKYCPCMNFESLKDIINVKRMWCEKAIKQGRKPRYKDVEDIATYEEWEAENDLPF